MLFISPSSLQMGIRYFAAMIENSIEIQTSTPCAPSSIPPPRRTFTTLHDLPVTHNSQRMLGSRPCAAPRRLAMRSVFPVTLKFSATQPRTDLQDFRRTLRSLTSPTRHRPTRGRNHETTKNHFLVSRNKRCVTKPRMPRSVKWKCSAKM
jgi:hypothetical protein